MLHQVALAATGLDRAVDFRPTCSASSRSPATTLLAWPSSTSTAPARWSRREHPGPRGTVGPPGGSEWLAFIRDSEGNLVGPMTRDPAEDERPAPGPAEA